MILSALEEKKKFTNIFKTRKHNVNFRKEHPEYFDPSGFIVCVGIQGGGKTLVAVNYVYKLMQYYPKCLLVTNINLTNYPVDNKRVFKFESPEDFKKYKNGYAGVIFLIDEIHLYLGSQKGNNNINPEVVQEICQQRKQRIHIVGTTQFYAQLNINLRRHFDTVVLCESGFFGYKQKISILNRESINSKESSNQVIEGEVKEKYSYWRAPYMFNRYDTYAVIENKHLEYGLERSDSNYDNTDIRLSNNIANISNSLNRINSNSNSILGGK